jgi:hypothetical protein
MIPLFEDAVESTRTIKAYTNKDNLLFLSIDYEDDYQMGGFVLLDAHELALLIKQLQLCHNEINGSTNG